MFIYSKYKLSFVSIKNNRNPLTLFAIFILVFFLGIEVANSAPPKKPSARWDWPAINRDAINVPTGPNDERLIYVQTGSEESARTFHAFKMRPGIYIGIQNIAELAENTPTRITWINYIKSVNESLEIINSTPSGKRLLDAIPRLAPLEVFDSNVWRYHNESQITPNQLSPVKTMIVPSNEHLDNYSSAYNRHGHDGIGTVSLIEFAGAFTHLPDRDGRFTTVPPMAALYHELVHSLHFLLGDTGSEEKDFFYRPNKTTNTYLHSRIATEELRTSGSPKERALASGSDTFIRRCFAGLGCYNSTAEEALSYFKTKEKIKIQSNIIKDGATSAEERAAARAHHDILQERLRIMSNTNNISERLLNEETGLVSRTSYAYPPTGQNHEFASLWLTRSQTEIPVANLYSSKTSEIRGITTYQYIVNKSDKINTKPNAPIDTRTNAVSFCFPTCIDGGGSSNSATEEQFDNFENNTIRNWREYLIALSPSWTGVSYLGEPRKPSARWNWPKVDLNSAPIPNSTDLIHIETGIKNNLKTTYAFPLKPGIYVGIGDPQELADGSTEQLKWKYYIRNLYESLEILDATKSGNRLLNNINSLDLFEHGPVNAWRYHEDSHLSPGQEAPVKVLIIPSGTNLQNQTYTYDYISSTDGTGSIPVIKYSGAYTNIPDRDGRVLALPPAAALYHELVHGLHYLLGTRSTDYKSFKYRPNRRANEYREVIIPVEEMRVSGSAKERALIADPDTRLKRCFTSLGCFLQTKEEKNAESKILKKMEEYKNISLNEESTQQDKDHARKKYSSLADRLLILKKSSNITDRLLHNETGIASRSSYVYPAPDKDHVFETPWLRTSQTEIPVSNLYSVKESKIGKHSTYDYIVNTTESRKDIPRNPIRGRAPIPANESCLTICNYDSKQASITKEEFEEFERTTIADWMNYPEPGSPRDAALKSIFFSSNHEDLKASGYTPVAAIKETKFNNFHEYRSQMSDILTEPDKVSIQSVKFDDPSEPGVRLGTGQYKTSYANMGEHLNAALSNIGDVTLAVSLSEDIYRNFKNDASIVNWSETFARYIPILGDAVNLGEGIYKKDYVKAGIADEMLAINTIAITNPEIGAVVFPVEVLVGAGYLLKTALQDVYDYIIGSAPSSTEDLKKWSLHFDLLMKGTLISGVKAWEDSNLTQYSSAYNTHKTEVIRNAALAFQTLQSMSETHAAEPSISRKISIYQDNLITESQRIIDNSSLALRLKAHKSLDETLHEVLKSEFFKSKYERLTEEYIKSAPRKSGCTDSASQNCLTDEWFEEYTHIRNKYEESLHSSMFDLLKKYSISLSTFDNVLTSIMPPWEGYTKKTVNAAITIPEGTLLFQNHRYVLIDRSGAQVGSAKATGVRGSTGLPENVSSGFFNKNILTLIHGGKVSLLTKTGKNTSDGLPIWESGVDSVDIENLFGNLPFSVGEIKGISIDNNVPSGPEILIFTSNSTYRRKTVKGKAVYERNDDVYKRLWSIAPQNTDRHVDAITYEQDKNGNNIEINVFNRAFVTFFKQREIIPSKAEDSDFKSSINTQFIGNAFKGLDKSFELQVEPFIGRKINIKLNENDGYLTVLPLHGSTPSVYLNVDLSYTKSSAESLQWIISPSIDGRGYRITTADSLKCLVAPLLQDLEFNQLQIEPCSFLNDLDRHRWAIEFSSDEKFKIIPWFSGGEINANNENIFLTSLFKVGISSSGSDHLWTYSEVEGAGALGTRRLCSASIKSDANVYISRNDPLYTNPERTLVKSPLMVLYQNFLLVDGDTLGSTTHKQVGFLPSGTCIQSVVFEDGIPKESFKLPIPYRGEYLTRDSSYHQRLSFMIKNNFMLELSDVEKNTIVGVLVDGRLYLVKKDTIDYSYSAYERR